MGVTALATDGDATDTITYSLDDDAGGRFAINASSGVVTVANNTLLDYETTTTSVTTSRFTIDATSSDTRRPTKWATAANGSRRPAWPRSTYSLDGGDQQPNRSVDQCYQSATTSSDTSTNTAGFTNLTDDNTVLDQCEVIRMRRRESAANGTVVGVTALATDGDATDTITYSLDDDAGGRFAINATSGVVTVANNTLLDYETTTSHNITVRATISDTSTNTAGFTINLTDDNTEFSISAVSDSTMRRPTASVKALPTARSLGVTALATDGDATDTITYSLDDDAGGRFAINSLDRRRDRGQQHAAGLRNHHQSQHHRPCHLQRHFSTNTAGFTINLTDDNTEFSISAVSDSNAAGNSVSESAANGDRRGRHRSGHRRGCDRYDHYSLDDDAGGRFAINASTGVVTVANNTLLDYETTTSHNITVRATSSDTSDQHGRLHDQSHRR